MNLKLHALAKSTMKSLVLRADGQTFCWWAIGDVVEVSDDVGHKLLSLYPNMLKVDKKKAVNRMTSSPENKVIDTSISKEA